jgi:hypothetical protein
VPNIVSVAVREQRIVWRLGAALWVLHNRLAHWWLLTAYKDASVYILIIKKKATENIIHFCGGRNS